MSALQFPALSSEFSVSGPAPASSLPVSALPALPPPRPSPPAGSHARDFFPKKGGSKKSAYLHAYKAARLATCAPAGIAGTPTGAEIPGTLPVEPESVPLETSKSTSERRADFGLGGGKLPSQYPARYRTVHRGAISKGALMRLARRGGVKRMATGTFDAAREATRDFLREVISNAVSITELSRMKTVTLPAVLAALKRNGHTLYGF